MKDFIQMILYILNFRFTETCEQYVININLDYDALINEHAVIKY